MTPGRRQFLSALGGAAVAWPFAARAQQLAAKSARIGFVGTSIDNPSTAPGNPAFLDELKKSGFIIGQNLAIESATHLEDAKQLFAETAALARSNVDLL